MLEPTPDILEAPFQAWVKQLLQGMGGKGSLRARCIGVGAWGPSECAGSEERPQASLHGALAESQGCKQALPTPPPAGTGAPRHHQNIQKPQQTPKPRSRHTKTNRHPSKGAHDDPPFLVTTQLPAPTLNVLAMLAPVIRDGSSSPSFHPTCSRGMTRCSMVSIRGQ